MKQQKSLLLTLLLGMILITGCGGGKTAHTGKLNVVATTGMITDAAANIGGERVTVRALMGPGVDPHLYKASEGDVRRLSDADLILYNGLHLEGKMTEVFDQMRARKPTAAVAEAIPEHSLLSLPGSAGTHDPHVWFDVKLWSLAAGKVRDALIELDAAGSQYYTDNARSYMQQLDSLDAWIRSRVASIPENNRVLITAHDAFNYFGRAYGVEVRGLQGISTVTEAGAADVQELANHIVERRIPAIFVESSVPTRNIEAVQAAVSAKGFEVRIGGQLFSDAMGNPGTPEGNYIGMVRWNVNTMAEGLSGESE